MFRVFASWRAGRWQKDDWQEDAEKDFIYLPSIFLPMFRVFASWRAGRWQKDDWQKDAEKDFIFLPSIFLPTFRVFAVAGAYFGKNSGEIRIAATRHFMVSSIPAYGPGVRGQAFGSESATVRWWFFRSAASANR